MLKNVTLIYNPTSGRKVHLRQKAVEAAAAVFHQAGLKVTIEPTKSRGTAAGQVLRASELGCDAVIACGGDGTVLDVVQGLVATDLALGVIPLGTKNALACDLGIPWDPERAARAILRSERVRIALGKVEFASGGKSRGYYFASAAGIGADAEMMYRLAADFNRGLGMCAYYREGLRIFLDHDYREFEVTFRSKDGSTRHERVSELLAVRLSDFGGLLNRLAPGADLHTPNFRLVLFKTRQRWHYLQYAASVLLRRSWFPKPVEMTDATEVVCKPLTEGKRVYVEADGELLGTLPVTLRVIPDACWLLVSPTPAC